MSANSLLSAAVSSGDVGLVRDAVRLGARVGGYELYTALEARNHRVVAALLDAGAVVSVDDVDAAAKAGVTLADLEPLLARRGVDAPTEALFCPGVLANADLLHAMLARGARVAHVREDDGFTPLHVAAEAGLAPACAALLDAGAALEARAWERGVAAEGYERWDSGETPLLVATLCSHWQLSPTATIALLVQRGADVNARTAANWTGLLRVARYGPVEAVVALADGGASVDVVCDEGFTPMWLACERDASSRSVAVARELLRRGAPVHGRDKRGRTCADLAGSAEMIALLRDAEGRAPS